MAYEREPGGIRMRVGVVGLGSMGSEIALKLLHSGNEVTVWNRSSAAVDALVVAGAKRASRVVDALQGDIALTILFDDRAIRTTLLETKALDHMRAGCIHVCMSTVSIDFARELERFHEQLGLRYAAAPMLGRPDVIARSGMNILVGGEPSIIDDLETPFANLGKTWRLGPQPIHANIAKLAANFMIAGALEAMAEASAVISAYGADPERFLTIMADTLFSSPVYRIYGPIVSGHDPTAPSGLSMPLKDIGHTLEAARAATVKMPVAEIVRATLERASASGLADVDWGTAFSAMSRRGL